ncbi:MAG: TIGR04282 family arsenosugar biosynthesis glycosyltransferase [bacterium]|nr:TIGR04282 family arsenosugar biosynthesis glycosyltransferase [bacterium]
MNTVVCLARMPELGKVKARIAATEGAARAFEIYVELVRRCRDLLEQVDHRYEVEVTLSEPFDFIKAQTYFGNRPFFSQQASGDLGQRMCVAAIRAFQSGARKVVLIGSDCPALTPEHLSQAFHTLDNRQVVLGPAADGGYYLLGMTRVVPDLFAGFAWGTDSVYAETTARLRADEISYGELPKLADVDTIEDWKRLGL